MLPVLICTNGQLFAEQKVRDMKRPDTTTVIQPLLLCPKCNLEMRLLRTDAECDIRDLYTFQCLMCAKLEVRGVAAVKVEMTVAD